MSQPIIDAVAQQAPCPARAGRRAASVRRYGLVSVGCSVALLALALIPSLALAQAGYVQAIAGLALVRDAAGRAPLKVGDTFPASASFATGKNARVVLKFADGLVVLLGPESALRVQNYRYDPKNSAASGITAELLSGSIRVVSGAIAAKNPGSVRFRAADSTIQLSRGGKADFTVIVDRKIAGRGDAIVAAGQLSVHTPHGLARRVTANEAISWRPGQSTLPEPMPLVASPAVVQAAVEDLQATALPPNTPVTVEAAASAARSAAAAVQRMIGYVQNASGTLSLRTASGRKPLQVGDQFEVGETLQVGAGARAVFKFADGQLVALGPDSSLRIDAYRFDPHDVAKSGFAFALLSGRMRFVAGTIGSENPEGARVTAGSWPINLVGTGGVDFSVALSGRGSQLIGMAVVTSGQIAVHTASGPTSLSATSPASYLGSWKALTTPAMLASGFDLIRDVVTLHSQSLPPNTPVMVQSAAEAALAQAEANQAQALASSNPGDAELAAAAREAALKAASATQRAEADAQSISGASLASALAALPPTAAGPPPAVAPVVELAPLQSTVFPGTVLTTTLTPAVAGCLGSPC